MTTKYVMCHFKLSLNHICCFTLCYCLYCFVCLTKAIAYHFHKCISFLNCQQSE